jgi:diguanylate cyclase (GGDEF)-like protein
VQHSAASTAEFRGSVVKKEAPRALLMIAGAVFVLSIYNALVVGAAAWTDALHVAVLIVLLFGAWLTSRRGTRPRAMPWVVAVCLAVLVLAIEVETWENPTPWGMAYTLVGIVAYAAFVLDPLAAGLAAIPMIVGYVVVTAARFPDDALQWWGVGLAALLVGALLLRVRLNGIDALGDLTEQSRTLATRDPLTGVFNRRGIEERVDAVASSARRRDEPIFVVFVDINGLKRANDVHGHDAGDDVIRATANALRGIVRASDFVGRWGGDEFVVLGSGTPMPPEALAERLDGRLADSGIPRHIWSTGVSLGVATASPVDLDFDDLVLQADRQMYGRRRAVRDS